MSALAALLLTFVLPALAGCILLSDVTAEADLEARAVPADMVLARGTACGVAVWLLGSGLLTRTVGLTATSAWVWDAMVGAASLGVLVLPRHRERVRALARPVTRRLAEVGGLTALVFLPLGIVVLHTSWSPIGSTPWYYYGLARQVADAGSIPATSIEFGTTTPFLNDYHLFTTGTAMLLVQHPGGPIAVLTIVTLIGVVLLGVGATTLASALGAGRITALLVVPIVVATGIGPIRLASYRPEGFALGLLLLVVALGLDWLRSRDRRSLAAATLLVATLSQVHGIAAVAAGVMVAAAALATFARGSRAEHLRRTGIALVVFVAAVVGTGLVFREASGTVHAGGLVDRGGLADPTWEFFRAARGEAPSLPQSNGSMLMDTSRSLYDRSWWWILPALLLAILGLRRGWQDPRARQVVSFTVLSLVGLGVVASVFMLGWEGYVPRRTGASRIPLEASLVPPTLIAVGLGFLARGPWTWPGRRSRTVRRPPPVLLGVLAVAAIVSMLGVARYDNGGSIGHHELTVWQSLPLRTGDVVLSNGYTEGFIPDATPAQGLLDGRAPYTFGALLQRANGLMRGAQAFFADPAQNWSFLSRNHVTWVVVGNPDTYALSTGNTWYVPRNLDALEQCAGLERVVDDPSLTAFRVVDQGPSGCAVPSR